MRTLKSKAEFDFVYKNSKKCDRGSFCSYILTFSHPSLKERKLSFKERKVFASFLSQEDQFYAGLSVSKKIGNAPTRNKIKRWFRAFCRIHQDLLVGKAIIFVAKDASRLSYSCIQEEMLRVLGR
ncbi:ribonuclease P protein component [Helicobacter pametensis]|uniref:ribonuclease P protein component n=1 Tax=Helicobacter pametensis TaxID=95149 RepID=UPI000482D2D8|nr:ribonuclease P protein component [Helicobacter pametensis]